MMERNPVAFEIERPTVFDRGHVFLRIAVLVVIGWIVHPVGLLWIGLPVVAAVLIAQKGGQRYIDEDGPTVAHVLNWVLDLAAYVALLTDQLPSRDAHAVRFEVEPSGSPTTSSAVLRIVYAIPSVIVLAVLTWIGAIVWVIAMVLVFVNGNYPESWWHFLCGIVAWEARLIAYLASLVDSYPPFSLDPGRVSPAAPSSS
jgi:hypothetical protein